VGFRPEADVGHTQEGSSSRQSKVAAMTLRHMPWSMRSGHCISWKNKSSCFTLHGNEKFVQREKLIRPWLNSCREKVDELIPIYLSKGLMQNAECRMQKALYYVQNNWTSLTQFMSHAELPIDNNPVETTIRPFTVGRRNWLYLGNPKGAHASAFIYSLVETAKANGLEPKAYLRTLFERYPFAKTVKQRRALLPMFFKNS